MVGNLKSVVKEHGKHKQRVQNILYCILIIPFALGIFLLLLNVASIIIPLRDPGVYSFYGNKEMDVNFTYQETISQLDRKSEESDLAYVQRVTDLISKSISPFWFDEQDPDIFHVRVPIWENYLLWAKSFIDPAQYLRYEYFDYLKAIERGIGLCSQYAIVASQVMEQNGVDTKVVALYGHVLTMAEIDDKWQLVDPEYNVIIPYTLNEVEQNPVIAANAYNNTWAPTFIVDLFASAHDNIIFENALMYTGTDGPGFEKWSYSMLWIFPMILMSPFIGYKVTILWISHYKRTIRNSIHHAK